MLGTFRLVAEAMMDAWKYAAEQCGCKSGRNWCQLAMSTRVLPQVVGDGVLSLRMARGQLMLISEGDFLLVADYTWRVTNGYATARRGEVCYFAHRLILGTRDGFVTDHINGDKLDNRRCNLRFATYHQSTCNVPGRHRSSRFKGVSLIRRSKQWLAVIACNHTKYRLGNFDTEIEAALAYDVAAKKYHGEFARLNFPELLDPTATS